MNESESSERASIPTLRAYPARLSRALRGAVSPASRGALVHAARARFDAVWTSERARAARRTAAGWPGDARAGVTALLLGTALVTLLALAIDRLITTLPNPGVLYLPLIAMLAYHWSWRLGALAGALQLGCVYIFFIMPVGALKPLTISGTTQLVTLAAVNVFTLLVVQLARAQRDSAARQAARSSALNAVGQAMASELDEARLLRLIAQTARELTGAEFAAFTLRPLDLHGRPLVPAEGNLFHLAAVVGVTPEQEALFRRMPLGGEGLLAPIFRDGVPVRVADALAMAHPFHAAPAEPHASAPNPSRLSRKEAARLAATSYAQGAIPAEQLHSIGVPRGHPVVRSFLGAPLLNREGQVRGGLLLGHTEPGHFTAEDERLLTGLAAQAAVALENARLYRSAQTQAQELDAIFDSINDPVMLVDSDGVTLRENLAASALRAGADGSGGGSTAARRAALERVVRAAEAAAHVALGAETGETQTEVTLPDAEGEERQYVITAAPLRDATDGADGTDGTDAQQLQSAPRMRLGAVVVWHDMTEARRLLSERQARAEVDARRALLQMMIDEMPGGIYLVQGPDARLVLANHAAREVWGAEWAVGQPMRAFLAERGVRILSTEGRPLAEDELATVRAVRTGEAVHHHQEIIRRPDGGTLPVLLNAVVLDAEVLPLTDDRPARDDQAAPAPERSALVVLQDVTALKEAERVKDEFITIAAHELKTPMTAMKGYTDMLRNRSESDGAAQLASWQVDALDTIDQATGRLVELTEDLLDVARLQAGRVELRLEPHDLAALARRVAKRLQFSAGERHPITVNSTAEYVVALLDVRRIEQVVGNLLSNAIKYSPEGGPITVVVQEDAARGEAILSVRDCGIGIPAEQQGRIFARFARADNARASGIGGTGLGLFLSRELVERHGGRIWFESVEGAGSSFSIALPLALDTEHDEDDLD